MKIPPNRNRLRDQDRGATSIVLIAFLILCGGCVGIDDLSREHYRKGVLYTSNLSSETIAILPMVARGENRHYLQPAESIFYKALTEMRLPTNFISPQEGLAIIKEGDMDDFFRVFEKETSFKRVAEERDLSRFRKLFGTRFLLQTELQEVAVMEGATQVRIQGRLWDIEMGDVIWEGTGESRGYLFLFFPRVPATFEKAIEVASRGLIRKLP
jgi:hypothetical protein